MAKFHTPLRVQQIDDCRWQLEGPLQYSSDVAQRVFVVPSGFITDFASVPRIPFAYMVTGGKAQAAAVIHDWLYSTHEVDRETADAVTLDVIDSGPGVPPASRDLIFDRFYRGDASGKGTGLGLSIAKKAVESSGGQLTLASSGSGGSTFRITLPRAEEQGITPDSQRLSLPQTR